MKRERGGAFTHPWDLVISGVIATGIAILISLFLLSLNG